MAFPRFVIDVREACRSKKAGKGQWVFGFVSELLRRNVDVTAWSNQILPTAWNGSSSLTSELLPYTGFSWHLAAAKLLRRNPPDLYVSPTSYIVPVLVGKRVACMPVVHDLIAFRDDPHQAKARWIERVTLNRAVKGAAGICCISQQTKDDLLQRYPQLDASTVSVVGAGPLSSMSGRNQADGKTILCVATLSPRKNQLRLVQAYALLPEDLRQQFQLHLVGSRGWQDADIVDLAARTPGVTWSDYVTDAEYARLLQTCTIFALPSLYEGFGMQILDALQQGIPCLTSDRGSLKEVAGSAALLVDPESVPSIAAGLERLLRDSELRASLRAAGPAQASSFTWERTVDAFLEAAEKAVARAKGGVQ